MSLRELKLPDCGTLRMIGFCEHRNASQFSQLTRAQGYSNSSVWKGKLLTLEDRVFSTLKIVSFMLLSASKMASLFECSLLLEEEIVTILCVGSVTLSSSLVVVLSFKCVPFSMESCLKLALFIICSTLQEKKKIHFLLDMTY